MFKGVHILEADDEVDINEDNEPKIDGNEGGEEKEIEKEKE